MTLQRIERLQSELADDQGLYVTNLINVRYLCGFTGSNGALFVTKNSATLATDSRYEIQSANQTIGVEIMIGRNLSELLLRGQPQREVLVEGDDISVNALKALKDSNSKMSFLETDGVIEQLRSVKDQSEMQSIRAACQISTQALSDILPKVQVGLTERQVRDLLENRMRELGADDIAFASIVAGGPNSAIPHHEPTTRELSSGDLLKIDFGAKVDGYHADCTRTFVMGKPAQWQVELHQAVAQAQAAGRSTISSVVDYSSVEDAVNASLAETGYREFFTHGLGHGVGLEIHEEPFFSRNRAGKIAKNTVITIEPGAYLPERGGVRIEDTVAVTMQGHENYTEFSYELIEL
ncbi:unannotated protein [freshwater metagenome]|uniref:Unannotated protein n=1 Tax=freshwater metagenome TaxID=449393 RepID=A0A6J7T4G7_9ZZZZ|nr:M24 family metallopeptidase [Actinomycetota bacterium]MSW25003.1 M24 family metallopeptidase [Actinomycetota bacterium]MSX29221.1 M24 family metallopeptidase [Actinomycetota bacterium]MSX44070.1 M24 family metallopeptidase [Actinomycetota bacterium]MSX97104.1 M24 family metallopeptidase [Actinomycetota bacterium]